MHFGVSAACWPGGTARDSAWFRFVWLTLACALLLPSLALAAPAFPPLSGRVVDAAGIIPADTRNRIDAQLKDFEDKSGIQLVVATVKSLEGGDIETYANQLFRTWQLGQKAKNNGALLLVAPNEHKVRVEVGYGLEGTLTDAMSKIIITNAMAPRFKTGDYGGGIERGVQDIIATLSGDTSDWEKRPQVRSDEPSGFDAIVPIIFFVIVIFVFFRIVRNSQPGGRGRPGRGVGAVFIPTAGSWGSSSWGSSSSGASSSSGSSWGSSGGGSFSGGGGSSGGGGASGSW
jgi:uncharacterized protein